MATPRPFSTTDRAARAIGVPLLCLALSCAGSAAGWAGPGQTDMPGMDMSSASPAAAWWAHWQLLALLITWAAAGVLLLIGRQSGARLLHSRYVGSIALLLSVYFLTSYVVVTHRKVGQTPLLESSMMDMSAMRPPEGTTPVATEAIKPGPFSPGVSYTGTVVAYSDEDVFPRVTGTIVNMPVYPGDRVERGQLLVRLDDAELSAREREAAWGQQMAVQARRASEREQDVAVAGREQSDAEVVRAQEDVRVAQREVASSQAAVKETEGEVRQAEREVEAVRGELAAARASQDAAQAEVSVAASAIDGAQAEVDSAAADATYWEQEIKRTKQLLDAGAASLDEYQQEQARAATAQAKLSQAKAGLAESKQAHSAAQARGREATAGVAAAEARTAASEAQADKARAGLERARTEVQTGEARVKGTLADVSAARAARHEKTAAIQASAARTSQASAAVAQSAATLTTARTIRGYTEIRATRPGQVIQRLVSPGVLVEPGTPILRVAETRRLRLQAYVSEKDLALICVGARVEVRSPKLSGGVVRTRVTSIFPAADPASRTSTIEAIVDNADGKLFPGDAVTLRFLAAETRSVLSVPSSAIAYRTVPTGGPSSGQQATVWLATAGGGPTKTSYTCVMHPQIHSDKPGKCPICGMDLVPEKAAAAPAETAYYTCVMHPQIHSDKPGKCPICGMDLVPAKASSGGGAKAAHQVNVTLGLSDGERTEVVAGLREGDEVVTRGLEGLQEGTLVYAVPWSETGPAELPPSPAAAAGGNDMGNMKM